MQVSFLEVLDRAHSGPVCKVSEWDKRVIRNNVSQKLKDYGLEKTCTPENPINTDDSLADEFWRAGFELAIDVGMLCLDTERVIKFTEEELREAIRYLAPNEITIGQGADKVLIKARRPEEKSLLPVRSGFAPVSEELFIPINLGIVRNKVIDIGSPLTLTTIHGRPIMAKTPYETLAGAYEAKLIKEVLRRAGRQGMPFFGVGTSPTEYGEFGGYGTPNGYNPQKDVGLILAVTELKTSYGLFHKVVNDVINHSSYAAGGHWSMIGGYVGPPEGAVLGSIAATIMELVVHRCTLVGGAIFDIRYNGDTGGKAMWAKSVSMQAASRNTDLLLGSRVSQVSGPCTFEILYELSAGMIQSVVSGCSFIHGNRSAGGRIINHTTPLEQKFGAEVAKSCVEMKRADANEIVRVLIPKYEEKLKQPPIGKSFSECYDLKTLTPSKEWMTIYNNVKKELADLGVPLQ